MAEKKGLTAFGVVGDLATLGGSLLVSYGAWSIYQPAGHIVLGLLLLSFGVRAAVAEGKK